MTIFFFPLLLFLLTCLGFLFNLTDGSNEPLPASDIAVNRVIKYTALELQKKHQLQPCGFGGSEDKGKHTLITCMFNLHNPVSLDQARALIIDSSNLFLQNINNDKPLQQYLDHIPFTSRDVQIDIYISNIDHSTLYHPNIAVVTLFDGTIKYATYDPENENKYKSKIKETYEEALKKLNTE